VPHDSTEQRPRARLRLQALQAGGDALQLGHGLPIDPAWLSECGGEAVPGFQRGAGDQAGDGAEALEEHAAVHILQCGLDPGGLEEAKLLGRGVVQQAEQLAMEAAWLVGAALPLAEGGAADGHLLVAHRGGELVQPFGGGLQRPTTLEPLVTEAMVQGRAPPVLSCLSRPNCTTPGFDS
jgi:hypothetical protein